jgi:hypothetical protein
MECTHSKKTRRHDKKKEALDWNSQGVEDEFTQECSGKGQYKKKL